MVLLWPSHELKMNAHLSAGSIPRRYNRPIELNCAEAEMTRTHEKLLVAALAGIIIAGAAVFAIQPAIASNFGTKAISQPAAPAYEILNLRLSNTI